MQANPTTVGINVLMIQTAAMGSTTVGVEKKSKPDASLIPSPPMMEGKIERAKNTQPIPQKSASLGSDGVNNLSMIKN